MIHSHIMGYKSIWTLILLAFVVLIFGSLLFTVWMSQSGHDPETENLHLVFLAHCICSSLGFQQKSNLILCGFSVSTACRGSYLRHKSSKPRRCFSCGELASVTVTKLKTLPCIMFTVNVLFSFSEMTTKTSCK